MSSQDNKAVVMQFVKEFKNKGNQDIVDSLFTDNFTHHLKLPGIAGTRDGFRQIGQMVIGAFPDVQVTIEDMMVDGDKVIERTTAKATHKGEFIGIPASNKAVSWTETNIYRLEDGKIAELWPQLDMFGLINQIKPQE